MISREKAFKLNDLLKALKNIKNTKFAYAITKNTRLIDAELEIMKEIAQSGVPEKLQEFESKRKELIEKYAEKNEDGTFKTVNGNYDVQGDNLVAFQTDYDALTKEYADTLAENEANNAKVDGMLKEEIDLALIKVKVDNLPDDLSAEELDALEPIIED